MEGTLPNEGRVLSVSLSWNLVKEALPSRMSSLKEDTVDLSMPFLGENLV